MEVQRLISRFRRIISREDLYVVDTHRILIGLGYIVVFIIGLYMGRDSPNDHIVQTYDENYLTPTANLDEKSGNSSGDQSFYQIGVKYQTDKVTGHHYEGIYQKYLPKYVGTNASLLEIGLGCAMSYGPGASAYLWRTYLGPHAEIHFLEYDQNCGEEWYKNHGEKLNIIMHYGNQEDVLLLDAISSEGGGFFDVIVDDGGHQMRQQITAFILLFAKVKPGGVYILEDLLTSYFSFFADAGYLVKTSAIEFIKRLVDDVQVDSPRKSSNLAEKISSFEISNSICAFIKK